MNWLGGFRRSGRSRRGSSLAEMLVAGGILAAGTIPLFGYWVKLAKDTGSVTAKARAFRTVQETVDRYQAMGPVKLLGLAGDDGVLGAAPVDGRVAAAAVAPAGRFGTALRLDGAGTGFAGSAGLEVAKAVTGGAGQLAAVKSQPAARVVSRLVKEEALLRLTVESDEFPGMKVERLMPLPIEPAAPAWQ